MKKVFALLIIFVLYYSTACSEVVSGRLYAESVVCENTSTQSAVSDTSSVQNERFFSVYHSVLNPDNDSFLNSSPLDKQFSSDLSEALNRSEEQDVLQKYINLWSAEMDSSEIELKSLLDKDAATAYEESKTAWENELDKDIASFSETYLSVYGSGSDIGIYTGYLMLEEVRVRALELIDQILFFNGDYIFSQTSN